MAITGPECYSNALGILRELGQTHSTADGLAAAQVYATLALAAATALNDHVSTADPSYEPIGGSPVADLEAWRAVAGTQPEADQP